MPSQANLTLTLKHPDPLLVSLLTNDVCLKAYLTAPSGHGLPFGTFDLYVAMATALPLLLSLSLGMCFGPMRGIFVLLLLLQAS